MEKVPIKENLLVSVIIPTYEREECLFRAVDSVLKQTYPNIEIIIVDDSKEDKKSKIKNQFEGHFSSGKRVIRYFHSNSREGAPRARNKGIRESRGDFVIAFLDDDDTWESTKIEKQVDVMLKNPDVALVICYSHDLRFGRDRISKPPKLITHEMLLKSFNLSSTSSYMVRKYPLSLISNQKTVKKRVEICLDCEQQGTCWKDFETGIWDKQYLKCGEVREALENKEEYFDENLVSGQEYDLAIRLTEKHNAMCVEEVLMTQNSEKGQISENWGRKIRGIMQLYAKHFWRYKEIGFKQLALNCVKTTGLLVLFFSGYLIGNKIYGFIIPIKEVYES